MTEDSHRPDDVLQRLLGPAEPELTCEQCFAELDRYVEVELEHGAARADELVPGMRAHLEGCQACDEEHRSLRALVRADDEATHTD
jgi:anti-sigma factor RsiW